MTADPAAVMRSYVIDISTYGLAEQAGMMCEAMKELIGAGQPWPDGMEFTYYDEEPYVVEFIWDRGDMRAKLCFHGDKDDSVWSVVCGRRRNRGTIFPDIYASCRLFLEAVHDCGWQSSNTH